MPKHYTRTEEAGYIPQVVRSASRLRRDLDNVGGGFDFGCIIMQARYEHPDAPQTELTDPTDQTLVVSVLVLKGSCWEVTMSNMCDAFDGCPSVVSEYFEQNLNQ